MSVVTSESTLIRRVEPYLKTGTARDRSLVSAHPNWGTCIDRLLAWWENPESAGDEDGFLPPSRDAIHAALQLARVYRDFLPPPMRVAPDGEGGLAFERRAENVFESLRVAADGRAELLAFEDSRLVLRQPQ